VEASERQICKTETDSEEDEQWSREDCVRHRCVRLHSFMDRQVSSPARLHCQGLCSRPKSVFSVSVSVSFKCNLIAEVPACKLIISNSHFLVVAFNRLFFIFIESFDSYQGYWRR
jgi:hypothetical protein